MDHKDTAIESASVKEQSSVLGLGLGQQSLVDIQATKSSDKMETERLPKLELTNYDATSADAKSSQTAGLQRAEPVCKPSLGDKEEVEPARPMTPAEQEHHDEIRRELKERGFDPLPRRTTIDRRIIRHDPAACELIS